ncbi:MAG TPA: 16S rRNA (guanine(966)-N(2))-methyltransferase RsmD [Candidatus Binatia bacterium]|nr:16S rRNA (guanine(966)-N(2))-methyltransferase RsmD [Candidatus Binatia bacterium]
MRVIGGKVKGHRFKVPKGRAVRPTAARVKEALFNILPHDLSGLKILDLFAGSGNLSVEALSRGAAEAVLVDRSPKLARTIRENLRTLGFADRTQVWTASALQAIRRLAHRRYTFDLVFVDPPYEKGWTGKIVAALGREGLLRQSGMVIAEHSIREEVQESYGSLVLQDRRRYGSTVLSFFRLDDSAAREEKNGIHERRDLSRVV